MTQSINREQFDYSNNNFNTSTRYRRRQNYRNLNRYGSRCTCNESRYSNRYRQNSEHEHHSCNCDN